MPQEETVAIFPTVVPSEITNLLAIAKAQALEERRLKSKFLNFRPLQKMKRPLRGSPVSRGRQTNSESDNFGHEVVYLTNTALQLAESCHTSRSFQRAMTTTRNCGDIQTLPEPKKLSSN